MEQTSFSWRNAQGLRIAGRVWRPDGTPRGVLGLLHGLGEHIGRYEHVAAALNAAHYALIGADLPGHGLSEGKRGHSSYDEILDHIDCLLGEARAQFPGCPVFLYGHSLGGTLVLYHALKRRPPINGCIVTSPGLAPGEPVGTVKLLLAKLMPAIYPSFTLGNGVDRENLSHDAALILAYKQDPLVHDRVSARLGLDILTKGTWIEQHASEFPVPLLLEQGELDHIVSPEATKAFASKVPKDKLTYKVWPGVYHETHNEFVQSEVIGTMISWLDQQTGGQSA